MPRLEAAWIPAPPTSPAGTGPARGRLSWFVSALRDHLVAPAQALSSASATALRDHGKAAGIYWLAVIVTDFVNDWLVVGLTASFRPVYHVAIDLVVWWTPWLLATPLLLLLIESLLPDRVGWKRSVVVHLLLMTLASLLHFWVASASFAAIGWGSEGVMDRALRFARGFTLPSALTYWGLVGAFYAARLGRGQNVGSDDEGPGLPLATRFVVRRGERLRFIDVGAVDWLEADGNYVRLHTGDRVDLIRATLSGTLERLDPARFIRIHRSTAVNLDRVVELAPWFGGDYLAVLEDGQELKVSRTYRKNLLEPMV